MVFFCIFFLHYPWQVRVKELLLCCHGVIEGWYGGRHIGLVQKVNWEDRSPTLAPPRAVLLCCTVTGFVGRIGEGKSKVNLRATGISTV